jgi:hypothetical protein
LPKTTVKIHFDDGQGSRYSINLDGKITKEKINKIMDLYQTLINEQIQQEVEPADTLYQRILNIIKTKFSTIPFTSYDIQESYEDTYNEPIKLAAISTYLARFTIHNNLTRSKRGRAWVYHYILSTPLQPTRISTNQHKY